MRKLRSLTALGISIGIGAAYGALGACEGSIPSNPVAPDAPAGDTGETLTGHTLDFRTNQPLDGAAIATDGIDPAQSTTSAADGSYEIDHVPTGSKVFVQVTRTNYVPTRSDQITIGTSAVMQDIPVVSNAYFTSQYTQLGKQPTSGKGIVLVDLVRNNGMPLEGIPLSDITIVDANNAPVTGILGPFFIGSAGDVDIALNTATAYNGHSRAIILDVAPGPYTIKVAHAPGTGSGSGSGLDGGLDAGSGSAIDAGSGSGSGSDAGVGSGSGSDSNETQSVSATGVADGAVLVSSADGATSGGGGDTGPADPKFSTDIYPRLQGAAAGGLGCGDCHAPELNPYVYTDTPDKVLATLMAGSGSGAEGSNTPIVDLANPANSLLLHRPLYEQAPTPQDHPNATFLDTNDPDYKLFLRWITNGAKP